MSLKKNSFLFFLFISMFLFGKECFYGSGNIPAQKESKIKNVQKTLPDLVSEQRIKSYFNALVRLSPRPAGSKRLEECRVFLRNKLTSFGLKVTEEPFIPWTPKGRIAMKNIIAEKSGSSSSIIYICSHIDTKKIKGIRFIGANDSCSSTAALLEIARDIAKLKLNSTYRFAFFDGEESIMKNMTSIDGLYGSKKHVQFLNKLGQLANVKAMILLDMVGDVDLKITRDITSSGELFQLFAGCCDSLGYGFVLSGNSMAVMDDHTPFVEQGIPSLDIIDFDYGPGNSFWHTAADNPQHVSIRNITIVSRCVMCMIETLDGE